jgi:hypothetical protein
MRTLILVTLAASAAFAVPALASDDDASGSLKSCGNAPKVEWKSETDIRQSAEGLGYKVRNIKVEDGCYEVYAFNAEGARVEAYLNPVSGELVREKVSR